MAVYKIDDNKYELLSSYPDAPDGFALNGKLCWEEPEKGKRVGFAKMEEGSVISCYAASNPLKIALPIIIAVVIIGTLITIFLLRQQQDIAIGGTILRTNVDENIVIYNGLMTYENGNIDIRFENGDYETTVMITGTGIEATQVTLAPGEILYDMPVKIESDAAVVEGILSFSTATSNADFSVLVEIPENMSGTTGLANYFEKEGIMNE